tara:strand:+ start:1172 stop:1378 length:207 start_codon:yes stop_codon:yes gene_type:complete
MTFSDESNKISNEYENNLREIEKILSVMMVELEQISSAESSNNDISNLISETMFKIKTLKSKNNLEEE